MSRDALESGSRQGSRAADSCIVEGMELGPFATNSYLVYPAAGGQGRPCWIIDPSFGPAPLIDRVRELALRPAAIVLTHAHVDHIAGVDEVLGAFPAPPLPVLVHEAEREWLSDPMKNLRDRKSTRLN